MEDNIIIENVEFSEEIYNKILKENIFEEDNIHGIGDDIDGNSSNASTTE